MIIPQYYKNKIEHGFGEYGEKWLDGLQEKVNRAIQKWRLTEFSTSDKLTYNFIGCAKSPDYGDIILKIGLIPKEFLIEAKTLTIFNGCNVCKCFDMDEEIGAMLLERILPGNDINSIKNDEERFNIAGKLISSIPVNISNSEEFPTYSQWINRAFNNAKQIEEISSKITPKIDTASRFFSQIENENRLLMLLHGDLNHTNILCGKANEWKAIDPHGVIGPSCMEVGRFMINQFRAIADSEKIECLDKMAAIFGEYLGESKETIVKCAFIDFILSTCWDIEENVGIDRILQSFNKSQIFLDYIFE